MKTKNKIQIDLDKVEQFAQVCDSEAEIAQALGVSYSTLRRNKKENEQFEQAIKRGKAKAHVFVGGKLMQHIKDGNVVATIFYLKCHGWREANRTELTGADGGAIKTEQVTALSNAELMAIAGLTDENNKGNEKRRTKGTKKASG